MLKEKSPCSPESDSTSLAAPIKPSKAYPCFHISPRHRPLGKIIRGQWRYFGRWSDPYAALTKYLEEKDALHSGGKPREISEGTTIKEALKQVPRCKN
jgi:hypothetical protein